MQKELKAFQRKLTNLTGNNKSLVQLRLSSVQDIDVDDFDFLENKPSFEIIEFLFSSKRVLDLCAFSDPRNASVNESSKRLKKIERQEKMLFEERGVKDLYLGWPFVTGKLKSGTSVRCPLLFFPVAIEQKDNVWRLHKRKETAITFNKSFLLAYSYYNEVKISEEFLETVFDDSQDSQLFRNQLYEFLKGSPLEINFNSELFENRLKRFDSYKKDAFESEYKEGVIHLTNQSVIGVYPQSGSYLVPDYDHWIQDGQHESLESFFLSRSSSSTDDGYNRYRFLSQVKEEQTFTPFRIDASQENALKAVKQGNSLVVQGPPGTGKSQLISNLIADFIARGKNVLLVCQKRVALDVVYQRLKEKDVGEFVGLVHDFKHDRKSLYAQIHDQVENVGNYQQMNNGLDTIHLEREYVKTCRKIDQLTEELEEYKSSLFDRKECGLTVKELYLTSDRELESIKLTQEYAYFDFDKVTDFDDKLKWLYPYASVFESESFSWFDRKDFSLFSSSSLSDMLEVLDNMIPYQADFSSKVRELLGDAISIEESRWILDRKEHIQDLFQVLKSMPVFEHFKFFLDKPTDKDWFHIKERQIRECFKNDGVELSLESEDLGTFQEALYHYLRSKKRLDRRLKWWFFSKDKYKIKRVLVANKLGWKNKDVKRLTRKLDNRLNLQHFLTELKNCDWLYSSPDDIDAFKIQSWFDDASEALEAKLISEELRSFIKYIPFHSLGYEEIKQKVEATLGWCEVAAHQLAVWDQYLTSQQISKILNEEGVFQEVKNTLEEHFDNLCLYDQTKKTLAWEETIVLKKLLELNKDTEEVRDVFQNSIRLAWIDHIETKHPILKSASTLKFEQGEVELQSAIKKKLSLSKDILLLKVREQTYRDVSYNRLNNMVTYRDLDHQVTKQRKIWPLRKLIDEYQQELFDLIPCWMASPEAVSAIFPMNMKFDLVIFDEASQCFSEKGLPAIYRSRQVVVTGDKHQLSPNDLYQVRYDDEEEGSPDLEVDSLLDLASKYMMQVQLNGHYRSESIDLIDFSNQHFYKGGLRLLPSFENINDTTPGIVYDKVEGKWEKGCNPEEAKYVVEKVLNLLRQGVTTSIGVVTFNFKQQNLIQDILEEQASEQSVNIPSGVFVKNIENVQGDERDIIVFSVGYAENSLGKISMHFGSLNMNKGENRLNVAVTRARKKVYVVTSILPHQLHVEDAKHIGPKLFKEYLEYAYNVSNGEFKPERNEVKGLSVHWYLSNKLQDDLSNDFMCTTDMPFADLTVRDNEAIKGLVLTDDNSYYQSLSAKEYHGYLPLSLKQKKWPFSIVRSRNYWVSSEKEVTSILKKYED